MIADQHLKTSNYCFHTPIKLQFPSTSIQTHMLYVVTDRGLCHNVQQSAKPVSLWWNIWFWYRCYCKEASSSKTRIPPTHPQQSSTEDFDELITSVPKLRCWIMARKAFCRILWCEDDTVKMSLDLSDYKMFNSPLLSCWTKWSSHLTTNI